MSTRSRLTLFAIGLIAALFVAWVLVEPDAPRELEPTKAIASEAVVSTIAPTSDLAAASTRAAIEPVVEPTIPAAVAQVAETANAPCLAGVLVLADGTPAPPGRLEFQRYLREKEMRVMDASLFVGTDADGRVAASACTGSFVAHVDSYGGNMQIDGIIDTPATDLRLVVPGYLMRVRVVDVQRRAVEDAAVTAEWLADPIPGRRAPTRHRLTRRTDVLGDAYLHLPDPGSMFVHAKHRGLASTTDEVSLRDAGMLTTHELVLTENRRVARFQLVVRSCDEPRLPIRDYCVVFEHFDTGIHALRITSEQVPPDGMLEELDVGKYRARLMPRYLGEPAYYADDRKKPGVEFVATDDEVGRLELCTELGGRIVLRVDTAEASADLTAQASIVLDDGTVQRPMWFRVADEGGVTSTMVVPIGTDRMSEAVLAPGEYVLRVSAKARLDRDVRVVVRAGEATHVAVELAR